MSPEPDRRRHRQWCEYLYPRRQKLTATADLAAAVKVIALPIIQPFVSGQLPIPLNEPATAISAITFPS